MKVYQTTAFVYKWIHQLTGRWYIGSRTAKGCHLNDGYICSSKKVKLLIAEDKNNWNREILGTGTPLEMRELESKYLLQFNASQDAMSYNEHNNNGKFNFKGGKPQTETHKKKRSESLKGIVRSEEYRINMSNIKKGKPNPKQSLATKGVPKPNVSIAKKGVPQIKVLCRLKDKKEMCLSHFNRWCNRQDHPEILKAIHDKSKGKPKTKSVCRLIDKREMTQGHFNRWLLLQAR
jgi:hypothetical protein